MDDITGCLHNSLISGLIRALRAFKFNYADMENAPLWLYTPPVDPDGKSRLSLSLPIKWELTSPSSVTFLRLSVGSLTLSMPVEVYVLQLYAERITLGTNDLASSEYAKLLSLAIPCLVARVVRRRGDAAASSEALDKIAYLRTSIFLDRHAAPAHWKQERMKQQRFIRAQDQRSRRCGPLYGQAASTGR